MSNKYSLVLVAAVLYGLGGALIRPITGNADELGEVSSFMVGATRSLLAFALTLAILRPVDCWLRGLPVTLPNFKLRSGWVWCSAISRAVNTIAFPTAIVFCSISTGYLLCNTTIIGMLAWQALIDKKRPSRWQVATAAVVVVSVLATSAIDRHYVTAVGLIAGAIGLFSFSGFFFFNGKIAEKDGPENILGAVMLSHLLAPLLAILAIALCAVASATLSGASTWSRLWQPISWPSPTALGFLLLIGVFQGGLADWLIAKGQAKKPNMMFMAFVPTLIMLWAPFLAWRTLGEQMLSPSAAIPFVLAHAAILYGSLRGASEARLKLATTASN